MNRQLFFGKNKIHAEWHLSGAEAVEQVKEMYREGRNIDLCLIDWKMPIWMGLR